MKYISVSKRKKRLTVVEDGRKLASYTVSVGKREDNFTKLAKGDFRTPEGIYKIIEVKKIVIGSKFGTRWMRINYPNEADIKTGYNLGLIDKKKYAGMTAEFRLKGFVKGKTALGFGIGIHGTDSPSTIGTAETEGCIRMKNEDIEALFALVDIGDAVIISD